MANPIKYILIPTLEDMAVVQIAVALWSRKDVRDSIEKAMWICGDNFIDVRMGQNDAFYTMWIYGDNRRDLRRKQSDALYEIAGRLRGKVGELKLPATFQRKVDDSITFICTNIDDWAEFHAVFWIEVLSQRDAFSAAQFCFTPHGTVDEKKMAEMIVKNKNLDPYKRYKFACVYCLRDDVLNLWNEMSKDCQKSILNEYALNGEIDCIHDIMHFMDEEKEYSRNMVQLWTLLATKKKELDYALYFRLLQTSVRLRNRAAIEYLVEGLKRQSSVETALVDVAKYARNLDILCFLLSKMTAEQQLEVLKYKSEMIYDFLRWPYQSFFVETVDHMWDFFSEEDYERLLYIITVCYREFLQEFWRKSPTKLKRCMINDIRVLKCLIDEKDKKNLDLMLRDVANLENKEPVNCDTVRNLCKHLLSECAYSSLEFFIRKCLFENPMRDEMLKFKEEFENYVSSTGLEKTFVKEEWDDIFEDTENGSHKRLRKVC